MVNLKSMNWLVMGYKTKTKFNLEFVRQELLKSNFELLSTEYKNNYTKLHYRCTRCNTVGYKSFNSFRQGYGCYTCYRASLVGNGNPSFKGEVTKLNLPLFKTYAPRLEKYEKVYLVKHISLELLGVQCSYCGKIFIPDRNAVVNRLASVDGIQKGENRFYCSEECKGLCSIYKKILHPEGFAPTTSREVDPLIRKLCFEVDGWECQRCGSTESLICHHILGYTRYKTLGNDLANVITFCKECHQWVHSFPGCRFVDLQCNINELNKKE